MREIQETVYEHSSERDTFTVTAAERWSRAMVLRLKERFPEEVEITYENRDGSLVAHMPLSWMRIVPKRRGTQTPEQKRAAAERLARSRRSKRTAGDGENEANSAVYGLDGPGDTQDKRGGNRKEAAQCPHTS